MQSFRKFVKEFFHFIRFNYNHIKIKQLSTSSCFNFMHNVQKNKVFFAQLPRISANSN